ncbi:MAG: 1-acyl-sn-glycerol-3-phosphate acyltransferase [Lachnospiraceae bacterium]|nr:1-acyl-sn-glycerol-3-phosphate acyltransferase [Lachnospiraceae bacterium]
MAIILIILFCLIFLFVLEISNLLVDRNKVYNKNSKYYRFLLNFSTIVTLKAMRIFVKTSGFEKLPKDGRFLLVANHRSKFDPIIGWWLLRKYDIAYVSKPSNFDVPLFGRCIRRCCFMPINREDPREALKTIYGAADLLKNDVVSVGIYPEGTRNYGEGLLPFHNGIFKTAQIANVPIVVMTTKDTDKIHINFPFKHTDVRFDVLEVIPAEDIVGHSTKEIGERVRNIMLERLAAYEKEELEKFKNNSKPDDDSPAHTAA